MRHFKKLLLKLGLSMLLIANSSYAEDIALFYQNPSTDRLIDYMNRVSEILNNVKLTKGDEEELKQRTAPVSFIAHARYAHPQLEKETSLRLNELSPRGRILFDDASKLVPLVLEIAKSKITNIDTLETFFAAFNATGNEKYLQDIFEFMNEDKAALFLAYKIAIHNEILTSMKAQSNFSEEELIEILKDDLSKEMQNYPDQQALQNRLQMIDYLSAEFGRYAHQDEFNKTVGNIFEKNPRLDYRKTIKNMLDGITLTSP